LAEPADGGKFALAYAADSSRARWMRRGCRPQGFARSGCHWTAASQDLILARTSRGVRKLGQDLMSGDRAMREAAAALVTSEMVPAPRGLADDTHTRVGATSLLTVSVHLGAGGSMIFPERTGLIMRRADDPRQRRRRVRDRSLYVDLA